MLDQKETAMDGMNPTTTLTPEQEAAEQEKKEILKRYRALLRVARPHLSDKDAKRIKKAFNIAVEAHKDVRRKSGEPYIFHPIEVARIVTEEMGLGATSIICALLHDVVEDTETKLEDLEEVFGPKVSSIVDGLTKVAAAEGFSQSKQVATFRKVLLTISEDIRVVMIKIADRLDNMRTLEAMPKDKQLKTKAETQYLYAPLAHRLGLYNIKAELDDLCFKYSNLRAYQDIADKIAKSKATRTRFINEFLKPIKAKLDANGINYDIKHRIKAISSIWKKMQKQNITFEEVYDLFALRIIIKEQPGEGEKEACWRVYSYVTDTYQPNVERLRDWISIPKLTGYESLHTTVMSKKGQWVEVQIRTERMNEIAEKGYAAHWKYKGGKADKGIDLWIAKVRESFETMGTLDEESFDFLGDFRNNFFDAEIHVFTPEGDIRILPKGATILDFAFDIHTEIGVKCMGGKVNAKLVPLNYELKNGDRVEIIKSTKPQINDGWLKMVKTSRAKSKIKNYTRREHKVLIENGKEIVQRKVKQLKMVLNDAVLTQLLDYFRLKTPSEFYYQVGTGKIDHTEIKRFKDVAEALKDKPQEAKVVKASIKKKSKNQKDNTLFIGDELQSGIEYSLAQCCNPIAGDDVFGIITISRGIRIHRTSCTSAIEMMAAHGDRIIKVAWTNEQVKKYKVELHVVGSDRMGIVMDVTAIISRQMKVNISSLNITASEGGMFDGKIGLIVQDRTQLDSVIREIEDVQGVNSVNRTEDEVVE